MALFSKRLAKFEQNFVVGSCFTMSQSFGMKIRFVLESTHGITHYVRSIPITLSVGGKFFHNVSKFQHENPFCARMHYPELLVTFARFRLR